MVKGVGIDATDFNEIERMMKVCKGVFEKQTFTNRELKESEKDPNQAEYLATRFAAKEAVFKALVHLTKYIRE